MMSKQQAIEMLQRDGWHPDMSEAVLVLEQELKRLEADRDLRMQSQFRLQDERDLLRDEVEQLRRERVEHIPDECAAHYRRVMKQRDEALAEVERLRGALADDEAIMRGVAAALTAAFEETL